MDAKDNRNQAGNQTKRLAASKVAPCDSDRDTIPKVTHKNKARTGVLTAHKHQGKKRQSIKVPCITTCYARRLKFLRISINLIAQKITLDSVTTRNPSRKACEEA